MQKMKGTNPVRIANPDHNVETRLIASVRGGTLENLAPFCWDDRSEALFVCNRTVSFQLAEKSSKKKFVE